MYAKALEAILRIYADKLQEYMTEEEYSKFNEEIIKMMICGDGHPCDNFLTFIAKNLQVEDMRNE